MQTLSGSGVQFGSVSTKKPLRRSSYTPFLNPADAAQTLYAKKEDKAELDAAEAIVKIHGANPERLPYSERPVIKQHSDTHRFDQKGYDLYSAEGAKQNLEAVKEVLAAKVQLTRGQLVAQTLSAFFRPRSSQKINLPWES